MEWSRSLAYFVGLITTDGCLSSDGRHINLTSKDFELVDMFAAFFGDRNRIGTKVGGYGHQRCFQVQLGNVELYRWLLSIGLTPRKSLTLGRLQIPDHVFADFLRGHLDEDGTICRYWDSVFPNSLRCYARFNSASQPHLNWLQVTIARLWSLRGYHNRNGPNYYRLSYAKRESLNLFGRIYYAPHVPCLLRKRQIADRVLNEQAEVAELADARASEARDRKVVGVQLPPSAPLFHERR